MKNIHIFGCGVVCLTLLLIAIPDLSRGQEGMEVLNYYFGIDTTPRQQWYPHVVHNPIDNEFMGVWRTDGVLRIDCEPGDNHECINSFAGITGRRISPDGELLGALRQFHPPELGFKMIPRLAHNTFTNEYLVGFSSGASYSETEIYLGRVNNIGDILSAPHSLYAGEESAGHVEIIFNPEKREYLVLYNDRGIFNDYQNNIGFILNEEGKPIKGPFEVGNQVGDQYAPNGVYNPNDNTYLLAWEDFRNVADWTQPCDIYGVLLDDAGKMITEIAIQDDYGTEDAGDQRVPSVAHNYHRNEFLVVWKVDEKPSQPDAGALVGRVINADGIPAGPAFSVVDPPRVQHWPTLTYVGEERKYFMTWTDSRNDGLPPEKSWGASDDMDIYARWLDASGAPVGDEIIIADSEKWQTASEVAYNPVMKRFLISWYDKNPVDDYEIPPDMLLLFGPSPSDVKGTIYGAPSFLSGRVIEDGTGNPVEEAWIIVIGLGFFTMKKTNIGGWWNIPKVSQRNGTYFIIPLKRGYRTSIESVIYGGEPLQVIIKAETR
jgi:hypothetical protein